MYDVLVKNGKIVTADSVIEENVLFPDEQQNNESDNTGLC